MAGTQWYTRKQNLYNKRSQGCLPMLESNILENIHVSLIPLFILCCFVEHQDFHHISCNDSCTCSGSEGTHMPLEVTPNSSPSRLLKKFFISFLTFGEAGKSRVFLQICWQDRWMTDDSCQQSMWHFWWSSDITKKCRKSMEIPTCHGWKIRESSVFTFFWLGIFYWNCKKFKSINPSIHLSSLGLGISNVNRKMTWMTFPNQTTIPSQEREDTNTKSPLDSADAIFLPLFDLLVPPPPKKKTKNLQQPTMKMMMAPAAQPVVEARPWAECISAPRSLHQLRRGACAPGAPLRSTWPSGVFFCCFFPGRRIFPLLVLAVFFLFGSSYFFCGILRYFFLMTYML